MRTNSKPYLLFILFITTALLCVPIFAHAKISITEISWMGSAESSGHEWIELTNFLGESVSVEGWKLYAADGSPNIDLRGTIPGQSSVLLERTSEDSVPGINAFIIYSGALGNNGEDLILTDNSGNPIDQVSSPDGWQAGDNTTKETMQLTTEGAWASAEPTPGSYTFTIPEIPQDEEPSESQEQPYITPAATSAPQEINITGDVIFDPIVLVNSPITITPIIKANGRNLEFGNIQVNFGDGNYYSNNNILEPISHIYKYPGNYIVTYELRENPWQSEPATKSSAEITVLESIFSIIQRESDLIELEYKGIPTSTIDLSGWTITNKERSDSYTLPPMTKIDAAPLRIIMEKFDLGPLVLIDNHGEIRAESNSKDDLTVSTVVNAKQKSNNIKNPLTITTFQKKNPPEVDMEDNIQIQKENLAASPILTNQPRREHPLWWLGLMALLILGLGLIGYLFQAHYPLNQDHQE